MLVFARENFCFNPLHCGAVVASELARKEAAARRGFNPLHCGAVVASGPPGTPPDPIWMFQSPSLRGSGRFGGADHPLRRRSACFNPLHCGAVVASSITKLRRWPATGFQSPSLRGSGRFDAGALVQRLRHVVFQSPSLRGSGRFGRAAIWVPHRRMVSIPFIAGQWSLQKIRSPPAVRRGEFQSPSLRGSGRFAALAVWRAWAETSFNPLHCGAVVASRGPQRGPRRHRAVSIPFIAGQWSLPAPRSRGPSPSVMFQSPSLRGSGRFAGHAHQ